MTKRKLEEKLQSLVQGDTLCDLCVLSCTHVLSCTPCVVMHSCVLSCTHVLSCTSCVVMYSCVLSCTHACCHALMCVVMHIMCCHVLMCVVMHIMCCHALMCVVMHSCMLSCTHVCCHALMCVVKISIMLLSGIIFCIAIPNRCMSNSASSLPTSLFYTV